MKDESGALFDAALEPHRSLGTTGFMVLMAAIPGFGVLAGLKQPRPSVTPVIPVTG